jgi:beta-glucosidase
MKILNKKLLRVRTILLACLLIVVLAINGIASYYRQAALTFFGEVGGGKTNSTTYKSDYSTDNALADAQLKLSNDMVEEGSVLMKNKNKCLPLAAGSGVTVFDTEGWCAGGTGSGTVLDTKYSYITEEYSLKKAGFSVKKVNVNDANLASVNYKGYKDAAIFVLSRKGGEGSDVTNSYLKLTKNEKAALTAIKKAGFAKTVVVLNLCNAVETGFLDEYDVDACLWVGATGCSGLEELGQILVGKANPSGHTVDTWVKDNDSSPASQNFGKMAYTNGAGAYVNYAEGIYVGYKYYETRYEDKVMGTAKTGNYDYASTVTHPFGYGSSYTDFAWSDYTETEKNGIITVSVKVTNKGSVAGKDVVEVYYQSPYTDYDKANGVEKASVNLAGFAKSGEIKPGESETVKVTFNAESTMKSYDAQKAKCYIMDKGDYYITAAQDAHAAVNNILAAKNYTTANGMDKNGNKGMVSKYAVPQFKTIDKDDTTGTKITNQFEDYSVAKDSTYLSRQNWAAMDKGLAYKNVAASSNLAALLKRISWAGTGRPQSANNTASFATGVAGKLTIKDMVGLKYDDPKWNLLLNQVNIDEMHQLFARGGYCTSPVKSVGMEHTANYDGPSGFTNYLNNWHTFDFPTETLIASSWNVKIGERMGKLVGEDGLRTNTQGWYAPAMNIHRTACSGRNVEYYSEDGLLSGYMGIAEVKGARSKGLFVFIKHFAMNDEETDRATLATWSHEQVIRELYLKPFEMAVKQGGTTGIMIAMNRIGYRYCRGNYALLTNVLRNEWGFHGATLTDGTSDGGVYADMCLSAGTNMMLSTTDISLTRTNSWTRRNALRESAHEVLYMLANSIAVDKGAAGIPVYKIILTVIDVAALIGIVLGVVFMLKKAQIAPEELSAEEKKKKKIVRIVIIGVIVIVVIVLGVIAGNYVMSKMIG